MLIQWGEKMTSRIGVKKAAQPDACLLNESRERRTLPARDLNPARLVA
jgi:hypothetical protein